MGGSTGTGLTSGLDTTKPKRGLVVSNPDVIPEFVDPPTLNIGLFKVLLIILCNLQS